jgi:hypothetical protein
MQLDEIDKTEMKQKLENFLKINEEAMRIISKYVNKFKDKKEHEYQVKKLEFWLSILKQGCERDKILGVDGFIAKFKKYPQGKRPTFGFSKGFGEFLWQGYDWQREILEAVDKIDNYYNKM